MFRLISYNRDEDKRKNDKECSRETERSEANKYINIYIKDNKEKISFETNQVVNKEQFIESIFLSNFY